MIVEFLPQAKAELWDAVGYYEGELNGLGQRFWDEVDRHTPGLQKTLKHLGSATAAIGGSTYPCFHTTSPILFAIQSFGFCPSRTATAFPNIGIDRT